MAVEACNEALKIDPNNVKALFRRAKAKALPINSGVEEFKAAVIDLNKLVEIDHKYAPAHKEINKL